MQLIDKASSRIFLVGPMGAGKTTIGSQLAASMKRDFCDSDKEIEQRTGASIPLIFELEGEAGFRKRETAVIDDLSQRDNIVIATGGGAVLNEENRAFLQTRGYVIYLRASLEQLLQRTAKDRNRPLLQTENPRAKLQEILTTREPLYQEVADLIVETGNRTVKEVVRKITQSIQIKA